MNRDVQHPKTCEPNELTCGNSAKTDSEITSGTVWLYFLYEISDAVDLHRAEQLFGPETGKTRFAFKYGAASYLQFQDPPLVIMGEPLEWQGRYSFQSRIKFYDYGVVSVTVRTPFKGSWRQFIESSAELMDNAELNVAVGVILQRWLEQLQPALVRPVASRMVEEYALFAVHELQNKCTGLELAARHGPAIAQLLRGERAALSDGETAEVMSGSLSYHPGDLLVVSWNAAFIFDDPVDMEAIAEILEFANSQLLEFRYYDQVLDAELAAVYDEMQIGRAATRLLRSYRYRRTARRLSALYLDISELTEKSENSLKFFGDLFASRIYRLAAQKLGLNEWKNLVDRKLHSAESLYRSLIDEVSTLQMQFMELAIVLILVYELLISLRKGS